MLGFGRATMPGSATLQAGDEVIVEASNVETSHASGSVC